MQAFVAQPTVTEEFYKMMNPYDRTKVDVLARSIPLPSISTVPTSTAPTPTSP